MKTSLLAIALAAIIASPSFAADKSVKVAAAGCIERAIAFHKNQGQTINKKTAAAWCIAHPGANH